VWYPDYGYGFIREDSLQPNHAPNFVFASYEDIVADGMGPRWLVRGERVVYLVDSTAVNRTRAVHIMHEEVVEMPLYTFEENSPAEPQEQDVELASEAESGPEEKTNSAHEKKPQEVKQ
jgi:hypothetical protein